ncbi:GNAT family N-acetyltransferase [Streptomyces sp. NPDC006610]|uniref:GNAT family N-acetyltransferase n=1 Tax=Streptomyces sp. NPDC006610 TaxID=3154584 RepID=UPI00339DF7BA
MSDAGGDLVEQAVAGAVAALGAAVERDDWERVRAGSLEWDCRRTATHVASCLLAYAGQLAGRAQDSYVPFKITLDGSAGFDPADNRGVLHVIETTGTLLAATVRTTPRAVRAFHPYPFRSANRTGFAAMGVAEVLLHTHDLTEGLGLSYAPRAELAAFVLGTIFPEVRPGPDPWRTLLWATGRGELPGRPRVTEWRWQNNMVLPASQRLTLEGVTPAAAADLAAGGDGGFDWLGGGPFDGTREAAGMTVAAYEAGVHRAEFGLFAVVRREDDRAIGGIGFHGSPDEDGRTEIGYDLTEPARGQGYATEALRTLADWALARDDVRSLFATVERDNPASRHVLARAGFTRVSEAYGEEKLVAYELRG